MSRTRREVLRELSALFAIPFVQWPEMRDDPLAGTIAAFQAGRLRRDWSAVEVTREALRRAKAWNGGWERTTTVSRVRNQRVIYGPPMLRAARR